MVPASEAKASEGEEKYPSWGVEDSIDGLAISLFLTQARMGAGGGDDLKVL